MKPTLRVPGILLTLTFGTHSTMADFAIIRNYCVAPHSCVAAMQWVSPYGNSGLYDASGGCRDEAGPPNMQLICFDPPNKRGHFVFAGGPKRCLSESWRQDFKAAESIAQWIEVACTW
ncbi:hypothetical protein QBC39DRAFT_123167 [Podospora conica]|nr:hypothetical protein QBC39DRAFT_123167 [Schizothecium conicum]